jgi:hypothetical protein
MCCGGGGGGDDFLYPLAIGCFPKLNLVSSQYKDKTIPPKKDKIKSVDCRFLSLH